MIVFLFCAAWLALGALFFAAVKFEERQQSKDDK